jgi:hypothetical protein
MAKNPSLKVLVAMSPDQAAPAETARSGSWYSASPPWPS